MLKVGLVVTKRSIRRYRWSKPTGPGSQRWRMFLINELNRVVGAVLGDVPSLAGEAGAPVKKVTVADRVLRTLDPSMRPRIVPYDFRTTEGFEAIKAADFVFGCMDDDVARIALAELCAAYEKRYFDLATDTGVDEFGVWFGGRGAFGAGDGCVVCLDLIDEEGMRRQTMTEGKREEDERIYGVPREALEDRGPSVVSLNAVVASLAVTEFMVAVTGLRQPRRILEYEGRRGAVKVSRDPPKADCYYCKGVWGTADESGVERFVQPTRRR